MASKKTDVPTKTAPSMDIVAEIPDYLKGGLNLSSDNFDASDIAIPRIKLLQGLSKECESFDTARPGHFWHTGMDLDLGKEIVFVICQRRKKYLLAAPMGDGQGVLARADDAKTWDRMGSWEVKLKDVKKPVTWAIDHLDVVKSGLTEWGTYNPDDPDSPPAATLFYDYLVLLPEHLELGPAVLSLARSQIRTARKGLNDKIQLHLNNGRPLQSLAFKAASLEDKNSDGQDFKNFQFTGAGFASEALYKQAIDLFGLLDTLGIQNEAEVDEGSASSDTGEGDF